MAKKKAKTGAGRIALIVVGVIVGLIVLGIVFSAVSSSPLGDKIKDLIGRGEGKKDGGNKTDGDDDDPPIAFLTADKYKAIVGEGITFDGNKSKDPGKEMNASHGITLYQWNFGYFTEDGTPASETTVNATTIHSFSKKGTYTVKLTVIDDAEQEDSAEVTVQIVPPNTPISSGSSILIGDPIGPGIFGNMTEIDWNLSEDATYMYVNITITGAKFMDGQSNTIDLVLEDPYLDVIMNETVNIFGTEIVSWTFTSSDISIEGKYNLIIRAVDGSAVVSVIGEATYL